MARSVRDPLQLVDVLTGAVAFEFRQKAGLAGADTPKARLAEKFRESYGIPTALDGCKTDKINVAIYRNPPAPPVPKARIDTS